MATFFLEQIAPPVVEPVTLEEALLQCHADAGVEDDFFLYKISAGRKKVEDYVKRSLMPQSWALTIDSGAPYVITLPRPPIIEIESVVVNGIELEPEQYEVLQGLPNRLFLGTQYSGGSLHVEYVAGYGEGKIPEPLVDAIKLFVAYSYENRSGEAEIPRAFYDLILPYKLSGQL